MQSNGRTHARPATPRPASSIEPTVGYITDTGGTILIGFRVERPDGEIRETLVTADARDGKVTHLTDWAVVDELAEAGYLERTHRGAATYGHVTYTVAKDTIGRFTYHEITFDEYHQIKGAR